MKKLSSSCQCKTFNSQSAKSILHVHLAAAAVTAAAAAVIIKVIGECVSVLYELNYSHEKLLRNNVKCVCWNRCTAQCFLSSNFNLLLYFSGSLYVVILTFCNLFV